jgi:hypothetical protein
LFFNKLEEVKVLLGEQGIALCGVLQKSEIGLIVWAGSSCEFGAGWSREHPWR